MKQINLIFENETGTKTESIEFELYDHPTVDKVCQLLEITKNSSHLSSRIDCRRIGIEGERLAYAKELNDVIYQINELDEDCQIPTSLMLDLDIAPHAQVVKLNRLHEIFQLYSEKYGTHVNETQELLERVNILVHLMESAPVEINHVFIVAKQSGAIPRSVDIDMTDEDHMLRMPHALWGVLEMDYSTIGKDIGACFWTDDADLIMRGHHRQQLKLTPGVAANFMTGPSHAPTPEQDESKINEFYTWCDSKGLRSYIDYTTPEYRLGRLRLGQIIKSYTMDDILDLSLYFPNVKEIVVSR